MPKKRPSGLINERKAGLLTLADFLEADPKSVPLEDLQALRSYSDSVIRPHLVESRLDPANLAKLLASVERQAEDARLLRDRLDKAEASSAVRAEMADLSDFLDEALLRLRYRVERGQTQARPEQASLPITAENDRTLSKMLGLAFVAGVLIWAAVLWGLWQLLAG